MNIFKCGKDTKCRNSENVRWHCLAPKEDSRIWVDEADSEFSFEVSFGHPWGIPYP